MSSPTDLPLLITGCDSGLGLAMAKRLHGAGYTVIASCLKNFSDGHNQLRDLNSSRMITVQMDITDSLSVLKCRYEVGKILIALQVYGLWCLINNAGSLVLGEVDWIPEDQCSLLIDTNIKGTFRVIRQFVDLLEPMKGRIVIVTSICRTIPYIGCVLYNMTKSVLDSLAESLRMQVAGKGLRVVLLRPGDYTKLTCILRNLDNQQRVMWQKLSDDKKSLYSEYYPRFYRECKNNFGIISYNSYSESPLFGSIITVVSSDNPSDQYVAASWTYNLISAIVDMIPPSIRVRISAYLQALAFGSIDRSIVSYSLRQHVLVMGNCSNLEVALSRSLISKHFSVMMGYTNAIDGPPPDLPENPLLFQARRLNIDGSYSDFKSSLRELKKGCKKPICLVVTRFTTNSTSNLLSDDFDQEITRSISYFVEAVKYFLSEVIFLGGKIVYLRKSTISTSARDSLSSAADRAHQVFLEGLKAEMIKLRVDVDWVASNVTDSREKMEQFTSSLISSLRRVNPPVKKTIAQVNKQLAKRGSV